MTQWSVLAFKVDALNPNFLIFNAAFKSLFKLCPFSQVQVLSDNCRFLFISPQILHILELGENLPITRRSLTLYSNICLNIPQPQSCIDNARLWFLTIFSTAKSSIQTVSYVVARYVVSL